jgi:hypothetical protein
MPGLAHLERRLGHGNVRKCQERPVTEVFCADFIHQSGCPSTATTILNCIDECDSRFYSFVIVAIPFLGFRASDFTAPLARPLFLGKRGVEPPGCGNSETAIPSLATG